MYRYCSGTCVFFSLGLGHKSVLPTLLRAQSSTPPPNFTYLYFKDLLESLAALARSSKPAATFVRWQRQQCFNMCVHQVHSSCRFLWYPHCTLLWFPWMKWWWGSKERGQVLGDLLNRPSDHMGNSIDKNGPGHLPHCFMVASSILV